MDALLSQVDCINIRDVGQVVFNVLQPDDFVGFANDSFFV